MPSAGGWESAETSALVALMLGAKVRQQDSTTHSAGEPGSTRRRKGRALAGADCFAQLYSVTAFTDSFGGTAFPRLLARSWASSTLVAS